MTLGNMRAMGVRSMDATCEDCRHEATVNVDALPDHLYVPDVALRMRCSACGSKRIITRPDWREHKAVGRGGTPALAGRRVSTRRDRRRARRDGYIPP